VLLVVKFEVQRYETRMKQMANKNVLAHRQHKNKYGFELGWDS
jgi:hypothetical protein